MDDHGAVVKTKFTVEGRKHPLIEIRERTLREHREFMRDTSDEELAKLSHEEVQQKLLSLNELQNSGESIEDMKLYLKKLQRIRHIKMWHDLSTVANHGHIILSSWLLVYTTQQHF